MSVYLVQHGKSLPKEEDPERGLSQEGIREVERVAELAKGYGIMVSSIKHSGKKRARQTAEIFASLLKPEGGVEEITGIDPLSDVRAFSRTIDSKKDVMYVGHLPFMARLVSYLICGDEEKPVMRFQNGGIVCLDRDEDSGGWFIKWTLMPEIR